MFSDPTVPLSSSNLLGAPGQTAWPGLVVSVRGASHHRTGLPNQDAVGFEAMDSSANGLIAVLAVSDGHGSARCPRSHTGAALAVEAAIACAKDFFGASDISTVSLNAKRRFEQDFPYWLVSRWRSAVRQDIRTHPFTHDEFDGIAVTAGAAASEALREAASRISPSGGDSAVGSDFSPSHESLPTSREQDADQPSPIDIGAAYLAYGATILLTTVTDMGIFYLQLGDGDILTVSEDGAVESPIPEDADMIANETTSLCMADATRKFRFAFHHRDKAAPALILVSSDGYSNSFASATDFHKVGADILTLVRLSGLPEPATVKAWLDAASLQGSGDDVSLGLLCRPALVDKRIQ